MNGKRLLNDGWEFVKTPAGTDYEAMSAYAADYRRVDIPHDWLIYDTCNLYESSTGWYRTYLPGGSLTVRGSRQLLLFDGVYMDSVVFVNGIRAGEWKYGYSSFEFDITELLTEEKNELTVQVNFISPNSRWYSGAGIYRNVWLRTVPENHIVTDSLYITARKAAEQDNQTGIWNVKIASDIAWKGADTGKAGQLLYEIMDGTRVVASAGQEVPYGSRPEPSNIKVESPVLWELDKPCLYAVRATFAYPDNDGSPGGENGGDRLTSVFGFRTTEWLPGEGFLLNGRKTKLHGVCEHHDLGALGAAFHKPAMRRKLVLLKKMGVNALRTSHNMPAREVMELADEMGILVVSEAFDMWEKPKTEYDYARFFKEWAETDVASWVRRDRNHPSLIMWSIGNEIHDTHADEHGQDITRRLMNAVLWHDPEKNGAVTIGSNYMPWENAQKCADIVKLAGYNYGEKYYDLHHAAHSDWVIYGSETSSVVQSRGVYHFPLEQAILTDEDEQCSSLGNSTTSWGAKSPVACICADRDAQYSPGQFLWTGHDYIGEPTPYQTKNSYFGQVDTAGFPKDSYYIYQAEWTDYRQAPMVHIFPYWDFNEGQLIDVLACSNAPKVELFVNGCSQGTTVIDHAKGKELLAHVKVPYVPGSIKAVAYDENGSIVAQHEEHSFGDSARIVLKADRKWMKADGEDMVFVEIGMEDAHGYPVRNAADYVEVTVTGAGRLLGLDNGDSTDYDQYKGTMRKLFAGKLLAIIGAGKSPGPIGITVTDIGAEEDIAPETMALQAVAAQAREGISCQEENTQQPLVTGKAVRIPIRKIALCCEKQKLTAKEERVVVKAFLYPADATDRRLHWEIVNDSGIPSHLADWEETEEAGCAGAVRITAKGDGSFRVRCTSHNGTDKVKLLSQLEFTAEGIGEAYLNPYDFIVGGLFNCHRGEVGSYNARGIGTSQDEETYVGYSGVDFGEYGSDELTIPVFATSEDLFTITVWEGMPGEEGSSRLGEILYQKPCIWDVYQEVTCKLNKRLKGITSIWFATDRQRLFIKGFSFRKYEKAYECLSALKCDRLYGDSYVRTEDAVEGIGNNVTFEYEGMDFGENGCRGIVICGRTPLQNNTIQLRFCGEDGDMSQLVEFPHSKEYTEKEFALEPVKGMCKAAFVFLPGCEFDFRWFRFV